MNIMRRLRARSTSRCWGGYGKATAAGMAVAAVVACGGGVGDRVDSAAAVDTDGSKRAAAANFTAYRVIGVQSSAASAAGVVPTYLEGNNAGDPPATCEALYGPGTREIKVDTGGEIKHGYRDTNGQVVAAVLAQLPAWLQITKSPDVAAGPYLAWQSLGDASYDYVVKGMVMKGGPNFQVYDYAAVEPAMSSDTGLTPPPNPNSGKFYGISHYNVCFVALAKGQGQWCSPGYWRNHLASWAPTGYAPDDNYALATGMPAPPLNSRPGECEAASADPTLGEVVAKPQCYGGDAFNKVGDLLSAAHPDVNFTGTRNDDCPLN